MVQDLFSVEVRSPGNDFYLPAGYFKCHSTPLLKFAESFLYLRLKTYDVIIAEGNFNLKSSDKDTYELMIDDKQFNMRMFMVYDDCSEIDILVQNFGYIRFKGIIK